MIRRKTTTFNGRTRWYADYTLKGKSYTVYQFLCTRKELKRSKYSQKIIPNPFLTEGYIPTVTKDDQHTMLTITNQRIGPDRRNGASSKLRHLVRLRDGNKCTKCGSRYDLIAYHTKGALNHTLDSMVTLCRNCLHAELGYRNSGEPDAVKIARPVRREVWRKPRLI